MKRRYKNVKRFVLLSYGWSLSKNAKKSEINLNNTDCQSIKLMLLLLPQEDIQIFQFGLINFLFWNFDSKRISEHNLHNLPPEMQPTPQQANILPRATNVCVDRVLMFNNILSYRKMLQRQWCSCNIISSRTTTKPMHNLTNSHTLQNVQACVIVSLALMPKQIFILLSLWSLQTNRRLVKFFLFFFFWIMNFFKFCIF